MPPKRLDWATRSQTWTAELEQGAADMEAHLAVGHSDMGPPSSTPSHTRRRSRLETLSRSAPAVAPSTNVPASASASLAPHKAIKQTQKKENNKQNKKNKQVRAEIEAAGIKMWIRNICTSAFAGEKTCQFCTQRDDTEDPFLKALGILNQPMEWAYQPLPSGKNGGDTCWYCQRAFEAVA